MLFERLLYLESNLLFLFSWYAIFLSFSVSGTQQTARMNDFGHGIDPHAVLPRLACQYTHTDLPCQYLRRPQNCSQTETLRQDFSRAKAHNKPGEDITKQTAGKLRFIACSYKKTTLSKHTATRSMIYCRILYNTVKEASDHFRSGAELDLNYLRANQDIFQGHLTLLMTRIMTLLFIWIKPRINYCPLSQLHDTYMTLCMTHITYMLNLNLYRKPQNNDKNPKKTILIPNLVQSSFIRHI